MPTYAGVGSRETPPEICEIIIRLGKVLCDLGWTGWSGEAPGADYWFHYGAKQSKRYDEVKFVAIIPWQGFKTEGDKPVYSKPGNNIYLFDAANVSKKAYCLGVGARGTGAGLRRGGITLHSRNALQVLGWDLKSPVKMVIAYSKLDKHGRPTGGTATAINLATHLKIDVINLYTKEGLDRAMAFLDKHEVAA
jgi:hypothetical protein